MIQKCDLEDQRSDYPKNYILTLSSFQHLLGAYNLSYLINRIAITTVCGCCGNETA